MDGECGVFEGEERRGGERVFMGKPEGTTWKT
jgi:hypothetical protein